MRRVVARPSRLQVLAASPPPSPGSGDDPITRTRDGRAPFQFSRLREFIEIMMRWRRVIKEVTMAAT